MTENKRFENRLNRDIKKFNALNPVWDNEKEDALNVFEMIDLLNNYDKEYKSCRNDVLTLEKENKQLKEGNKELKELVSEVDNELEIRDTVCRAGKFRLEEWGKHRYHQFYKGDEELEDESVVIMLMESEKENNELKASLYAEKTNTAEVVNDYAKQFKRHSAQFSFMMDLAEDLGVDVRKLEALDD